MKIILKIFFATLLLFLAYNSAAQNTTQGKDFWVSFGKNNIGFPAGTISLQVRIVTEKDTNVKLYFTELDTTISVFLSAGSVYTRDLLGQEFGAVYSTSFYTKKSLHIQSDETISVYAINLCQYTTDATIVYPTNSLGTSYFHMSYQSASVANDGYTLIATEDNTDVFINGVLYFTFDKGEVASNYYPNSDQTGLKITSNKPIAHFTTNDCAFVPYNWGACDCLFEQMVPVKSYGKTFIVPVTVRGKERIRILATEDNTEITQTGGTIISGVGTGLLSLNSGQFVELEINSTNKGCFIVADKPVAVTSFLVGILYKPLDHYLGDPALTWIPPIDQMFNHAVIAPFIPTNSSVLKEHYAIILTATANKNLTTLKVGDGVNSPVPSDKWVDNPSGYSFCSLQLTSPDSAHVFQNSGGLIALAYGLGDAESYYYLAGSALRKLDNYFTVNDTHIDDISTKIICENDSVRIKAQLSNNNHQLTWYINNVEQTQLFNKTEWDTLLAPNKYTIAMVVKYQGSVIDSIAAEITITKTPKISLPDTVKTCYGKSITLQDSVLITNAEYSWYTGSNLLYTGNTFTSNALFTDTVYTVEVNGTACLNFSRKDVNVKVINLTLLPDTLPLYEPNVPYSIQITTNAVQPVFSYTGELPTGITISSSGLISGTVPESANHEEKLFTVKVTDSNGCTITKDYVLGTCEPPPTIPLSNISYCLNATATPIEAISPSGLKLQWYNGDGVTKISSTPVPATGSTGQQIYYVAQVNDKLKCEGVKAKVTVTITPLPSGKFDLSADSICYDTSPVINFSNLNKNYTYSVFNNDQSSLIKSVSNETSINLDLDVRLKESSSFYIKVNDTLSCFSDEIKKIDISVIKLYLLPLALPQYKMNVEYNAQLTTNGINPVYQITDGLLPNGLYLHSTGLINGTVLRANNPNTMEHTFTIQVKDINGCITENRYSLYGDIFIPKVFTPNEDGTNDYFMKGYKVVIFDRLGNVIFRGEDGWDGTYKGKPAPVDIYFYLLEYMQGAEKVTKNGYIGLER